MLKHNFIHKIDINDLTEGFFLRSLFLENRSWMTKTSMPIIGDDDSGYQFTVAYRISCYFNKNFNCEVIEI